MKRNQILSTLFIALFAGSAQLVEARPGGGHGGGGFPGGGGIGHPMPGRPLPGRPGVGRPDFDQRDRVSARRAFDILNVAQSSASRYNLDRSMRQLQDAKMQLQGIRNGSVYQARNRVSFLIQRLNQYLYNGDRRAIRFESQNAVRVIENAKRDLIQSGLLGRR